MLGLVLRRTGLGCHDLLAVFPPLSLLCLVLTIIVMIQGVSSGLLCPLCLSPNARIHDINKVHGRKYTEYTGKESS